MNTNSLKLIPIAVMLLCGIFSLRAQTVTPGGVKNSNFTWMVWLTSDNYLNGVWANKITGSASPGNFSSFQPPLTGTVPPQKVTGYNFQQAVRFAAAVASSAPNQMESSGTFAVGAAESFAAFIVAKKGSSRNDSDSRDYMLGYYTGNNGISWNCTATNLYVNWRPGYERNLGNAPSGIIAVDVSNQSGSTASPSPIYWYTNGAANQLNLTVTTANGSSGGAPAATVFYPLRIGSSRLDNPGERGFNGDIQEIIILKRNMTGGVFTNYAGDLQKIQSYLAVKYGITLSTPTYVNSDGVEIYRGNGYNYNIFGIGRDDASGLYQKQAQSINNIHLNVYLGNELPALNSLNNATFAADKQFLMIGANNNAPAMKLAGIDRNEEFSNGRLDSSTDLNMQSPTYKAQMTGITGPMTVTLTAPSRNFTYLLVSTDPDCPPGYSGTTLQIPVNAEDHTVKVTFDEYYKYFKFIGNSPGPGGVSDGLRLWLRADDETSLELANLTIDPRLSGYPDRVSESVAVPAVLAWSDFVRNQTYSYNAGPTTGNAGNDHRIPVLKYHSPEMNYHPAVRFWGLGSSFSSYLTNPSTNVMPWARPPQGFHTCYLLVNGDFSTAPWIYPFGFGRTDVIPTGGPIPQPGYGVQKITSGVNKDNVVGRFRSSGDETQGGKHLFDAGSTSLLGYSTRTNTTGATNPAFFRFNGKEDNTTSSSTAGDRYFDWADINFQTPSTLGSAYAFNRTIIGTMGEVILYDRLLTDEETRLLESYMALKYGITLPSFTYLLSDGTVVWDGNAVGTPFSYPYYNNIAAVIRDDDAKLYNRHSHSTNVGSLLHLGVADTDSPDDTRLSDDDGKLGSLNDKQAVVFGDNHEYGSTRIIEPGACGDFTDRFNRIWLIHKVNIDTITLIVGAQDNSKLTIGADDGVIADYYSVLNLGYDVNLIVGNSEQDIRSGNYAAVVPMTFVNGEYQCSYVFTKQNTYITFGWKENPGGCSGDPEADFTGIKIFPWTQWTSSTNRNPSATTGLKLSNGPYDLGDNIEVVKTAVTFPGNGNDYPIGVRANIGYPRVSNSPERGCLYIQRRGGYINTAGASDVIDTIKFNHPVVPQFYIVGLDNIGNCFEEVEIYGLCYDCTSGTKCDTIYSYPKLSYASLRPKYKITGNRATVKIKGASSPINKDGRVEVQFRGGVTDLIIKYRPTNVRTTGTQRISVSPIRITSLPPLPPVNEDGLGFGKAANKYDVSTCESVEYTFTFVNANCEDKTVVFSDSLPRYMKWQAGSVSLGEQESQDANPNFGTKHLTLTGAKMAIDSLIIPGSRTVTMRAAAVFDDDAPDGTYPNQAVIYYTLIKNNKEISQRLYSSDPVNRVPVTTVYATHGERAEKITVTDTYSRKTYVADSKIAVSYTFDNPNVPIGSVFLDIDFNDEFTYVSNSFTMTNEAGNPFPTTAYFLDSSEAGILHLMGKSDGSGFTLPAGKTTVTFTLQAPHVPLDELDVNMNPTGTKVDLNIGYHLSSEMTEADPCLLLGAIPEDGTKAIPHATGLKSSIISNKNVTTKVK